MQKGCPLFTSLLICLAVLLTACGEKANPAEGLETAPVVGALAPDFTLKALDGSSVTLSELRGTPVFLNFWNVNCQYCKYEMPIIQKVYDERGDDLIIFGVNVGDNQKQVEAYLRTNNISFPTLLDEKSSEFANYRVPGLPTSFFIDEHGIVRIVQIGEMSTEMMNKHVKEILR